MLLESELAIAPMWLADRNDNTALALYIRLQAHGALHRYVRPPVTQLAREMQRNRSTIYRALARLVSYGAIRERRQPGGLAEWFCLLDLTQKAC